jgi:predicted phage terminase large subunit-like protein
LDDKENGVIIIVMQRLHQDDLVGHVLEQENWEVLSFPAIAVEDEKQVVETPFGEFVFERHVGDVMDLRRESLETLLEIKRIIGEYNFASQYQQNPISADGGIVKREWLQYYDPAAPLPNFTRVLQSRDTANKSGELNDYSVCTTWGVYDGRYYLLGVLRKRLNYPELKRTVREEVRKYPRAGIIIEDRASGTQLIQDLKAEGVYGIKPFDPPPGTDKIMRLHAQSAEFESGKVLLPSRAPWLDEYVNELTGYPGSKFDDQIDSTTQALQHIKENRSLDIWAKLGRGY